MKWFYVYLSRKKASTDVLWNVFLLSKTVFVFRKHFFQLSCVNNHDAFTNNDVKNNQKILLFNEKHIHVCNRSHSRRKPKMWINICVAVFLFVRNIEDRFLYEIKISWREGWICHSKDILFDYIWWQRNEKNGSYIIDYF